MNIWKHIATHGKTKSERKGAIEKYYELEFSLRSQQKANSDSGRLIPLEVPNTETQIEKERESANSQTEKKSDEHEIENIVHYAGHGHQQSHAEEKDEKNKHEIRDDITHEADAK